MAEEKKTGICVLWKNEDWLSVWIGTVIIALVLLGFHIKATKFKWTTNEEFNSYITKAVTSVYSLKQDAKEKDEKAIREKISALTAAIERKDRKMIVEAAGTLEETAKNTNDKEVGKKAGNIAGVIKKEAGNLLSKIISAENIAWSIIVGVIFLISGFIAVLLMGEQAWRFVIGFPALFILAWIAQFISGNYTISYYGVEYVLWALFLGLFISNVLGLPEWLKGAVKTELYIKTGVVILGSGVLFGEIVKAGNPGIIQALIVVFVVWYFCFLVAKKLKVDDEFAAVLASGVSICGVSAAIATGGAIKADPKKVSYTTSIILICAVPMLLLQPLIAKWVGMPDMVAGAWIGGTLDTTGSVVAASELVSPVAMKIGVIVKLSQNVLIGGIAFLLAIWFTFKNKKTERAEKPKITEIWERFPKFVLGFIGVSLVFSFLLDPKVVSDTKDILKCIQTWWFCLAFTSIGLETRLGELARLGSGRPAIAFLIAQGFNILWTLLFAYLLFGGFIFSIPDMR